MRCLPASKIPLAQGRCLHDWHAEIVAIRALNLFLLDECAKLATNPDEASLFIDRGLRIHSTTAKQPFAIRDNVRIYMYCSEAPCGDASMELVMNSQDDATPWTRSVAAADGGGPTLRGRGFFSELGIVRRKPARGDAPETLSKSCSDKLSMKQCTSLLSSITSTLVHPGNAYIHSLVLPESQYVSTATDRAFSRHGRMSGLATTTGEDIWRDGYSFRPFDILTTSEDFSYSRRSQKEKTSSIGSNITAIWTPHRQEVLVGGTIQGFKQFSTRGSSAISRQEMWRKARDIGRQHGGSAGLCAALEEISYHNFKVSTCLERRRIVKEHVRATALHNWIRNEGDDGFSLDGDMAQNQDLRS